MLSAVFARRQSSTGKRKDDYAEEENRVGEEEEAEAEAEMAARCSVLFCTPPVTPWHTLPRTQTHIDGTD